MTAQPETMEPAHVIAGQQRFYADEVATNYDRLVEWVVGGWHESPRTRMGDFLTQLWARQATPTHEVLEICCGTGLMLQELIRRGYAVSGLDQSAAMLAQARQRLGAGVELVQAVLPDIPLRHQFDAVISSAAAFNYLPDTEAVLGRTFQSVAQVLRPGGTFVFDIMGRTMLQKHMVERFGTNVLATDLGDAAFLWKFAADEAGRYSDLTYVQFTRDSSLPEGLYTRTTELHRMYVHEHDIVRRLAGDAGFVDIQVFDNYSQQPAGADALYETWTLTRA
ncbi:class I SAM-dependent DNA methyltransferase [Goodfellowiella coeruleoviolacea]|uniref:Methyltransferase domain-containing protein n=1 Tax=Goodfellowiella coeruleoviolacea TaxID=334858 RepID=A0AAE3KJF5_9PSEU|nr:class I SAM-dependent methyltransferase [Goodfellowiella coeruleoviolacea]MCP2164243.1 Methyltransferase domain-containing protein [Goodfellowiella coeruleoviolacea]